MTKVLQSCQGQCLHPQLYLQPVQLLFDQQLLVHQKVEVVMVEEGMEEVLGAAKVGVAKEAEEKAAGTVEAETAVETEVEEVAGDRAACAGGVGCADGSCWCVC